MKNVMKYLLLGSNKQYPVYAQYVQSEDGKLRTYNNSVYTEFDEGAPFQGCTNIYVLNDLLKSIDEDYLIEDSENFIKFSKGDFKTKLNKINIDVPSLSIQEPTEYIQIDDDLLSILDEALMFTGDGIYEYVYINGSEILSTNGRTLFKNNSQLDINNPIGLNKSIINSLESGDIVYKHNNSIAVKKPNGIIVFEIDDMFNYPCDAINNFSNTILTLERIEIAEVSYIKSAIEEVKHLFFGEKNPQILISCSDNQLEVNYESPINGVGINKFNIESDANFSIRLGINYLKPITIDYKFYSVTERSDIIVFYNNNSFIITKGDLA